MDELLDHDDETVSQASLGSLAVLLGAFLEVLAGGGGDLILRDGLHVSGEVVLDFLLNDRASVLAGGIGEEISGNVS